MSAYALLPVPGTLLPPFSSFGIHPQTICSTRGEPDTPFGCVSSTAKVKSIILDRPPSPSPTSITVQSPEEDFQSAFKRLALHAGIVDDTTVSSSFLSPSLPADAVVTINTARVDSEALTKTSRVTKHQALFPKCLASNRSNAPEQVTSMPGMIINNYAVPEKNLSDNEIKEDTAYSYSICNEDRNYDEECSMYDYSDDFSTQIADDDVTDCNSHSSSDWSLTAVVFELSINFQGRKYNATRAFSAFVELRDDLLCEFGDIEANLKKHRHRYCRKRQREIAKEDLSVPALPDAAIECNGFAMLRATAEMSRHEMEQWLMQLIVKFPDSQSLSSFLWEPLATDYTNLNTIEEESVWQ